MRKICYVQKVEQLIPIDGADRIEIAKIKGWNVVVQKNSFNIDDMCVYFEIDSFIPKEIEYFSFLSKYNPIKKDLFGEEGYVIKTIKLKGVISQGLVIPIKELICNNLLEDREYKIEEDVSSQLKIKIYERPEERVSNNFESTNQPFPTFIPKTDVERLQNTIEYFKELKEMSFEITEKLDGTSCTIYYYNDGNTISKGVCSKNLNVTDSDNIYSFVNTKYRILDKLEKLNRNLAIQGEIVGHGIQKNPYRLSELQFYVFDVYDIDRRRYLFPNERRELINTYFDTYSIGIPVKHVPCVSLYSYVFKDVFKTIDDALKFVKTELKHSKISHLCKTIEGMVFKSNSLDKKSNRVTFKIINNDYLLKEED